LLNELIEQPERTVGSRQTEDRNLENRKNIYKIFNDFIFFCYMNMGYEARFGMRISPPEMFDFIDNTAFVSVSLKPKAENHRAIAIAIQF
jgi:hypothetical protein